MRVPAWGARGAPRRSSPELALRAAGEGSRIRDTPACPSGHALTPVIIEDDMTTASQTAASSSGTPAPGGTSTLGANITNDFHAGAGGREPNLPRSRETLRKN